jgi:hypothetical protein
LFAFVTPNLEWIREQLEEDEIERGKEVEDTIDWPFG